MQNTFELSHRNTFSSLSDSENYSLFYSGIRRVTLVKNLLISDE
jgi:hypothetical protein